MHGRVCLQFVKAKQEKDFIGIILFPVKSHKINLWEVPVVDVCIYRLMQRAGMAGNR